MIIAALVVVALLVGAATAAIFWPRLVERAEHARRVRLVREAKADLRAYGRAARRARYDVITPRPRR